MQYKCIYATSGLLIIHNSELNSKYSATMDCVDADLIW